MTTDNDARARALLAYKRVRAIAELSDYPDDHTVRGACLIGVEYDLTFGDLRAITRTLSTPDIAGERAGIVGRLCELHRRVLLWVECKSVPELTLADGDTLLDAATALATPVQLEQKDVSVEDLVAMLAEQPTADEDPSVHADPLDDLILHARAVRNKRPWPPAHEQAAQPVDEDLLLANIRPHLVTLLSAHDAEINWRQHEDTAREIAASVKAVASRPPSGIKEIREALERLHGAAVGLFNAYVGGLRSIGRPAIHCDHDKANFAELLATHVTALSALSAPSENAQPQIGGGIEFFPDGSYTTALAGQPFPGCVGGYVFVRLPDATIEAIRNLIQSSQGGAGK